MIERGLNEYVNKYKGKELNNRTVNIYRVSA